MSYFSVALTLHAELLFKSTRKALFFSTLFNYLFDRLYVIHSGEGPGLAKLRYLHIATVVAPRTDLLMWTTETLRTCKTLVMSAADTWERFIWSENIWSEDFQRTEDQELTPDVHDAHPQSLQDTTEVLQVLPTTSQKTPDPQNGRSGCGSVYDAHPLIRPRTTRVLEILPATSQDLTDTISCRLSVISLDPPFLPWAHKLLSLDYVLDYRAVSYVWGDPSVTNTIIIDGKPFTVRANLWNFLAQARKERFSGSLWIDAISINQTDVEERSSQVANMSLIYSKAINVWAWVGLGTKKHLSAFQRIAEIDWLVELQQVKNVQESSAIKQQFKSLSLILGLEYWSRLWIIQEYVLARCVTLQCGPEVLSDVTLDYIARVVVGLRETTSNSYISLYHSAGVRVLNMRKHHTAQMHKFYTAGLYFTFLILESYWAKARCSVLHDHVYSLLSLHSVARSEIVPDYAKHPLQLFHEVVSFLDRTSGADPQTIKHMPEAMKVMQRKLGLIDCAEATQARLRVINRLESIK